MQTFLHFLKGWLYTVLINAWVICKDSSQQIIYEPGAFHGLKSVNDLIMVPVTKYKKVIQSFPEWQWNIS